MTRAFWPVEKRTRQSPRAARSSLIFMWPAIETVVPLLRNTRKASGSVFVLMNPALKQVRSCHP